VPGGAVPGGSVQGEILLGENNSHVLVDANFSASLFVSESAIVLSI